MDDIKHMKEGKSAGYYSVTVEKLRGDEGLVAGLLQRLFNLCHVLETELKR